MPARWPPLHLPCCLRAGIKLASRKHGCPRCSHTCWPCATLQESLGFLNAVIPRRVVQRMLSAALSLGPLAAVAAPPPQQAAAVAAEAAAADPVASAPGTPASGGGGVVRRAAPGSPVSPFCGASRSGGWTPRSPMAPAGPAELAPASPLAPQTAAARAAVPGGEASPERLAFAAEPAAAAEVKTLRQKWNLEFADPLLEER